MAALLPIEEPTSSARAHAPQWRAFFELGFRPLYLMGCTWAIVSLALWIFAPQWLAGKMAGVVWHAHEMLWGFITTIALGFLFTAGANWTGVNPLRGNALATFCALWLTARCGFLIAGDTAFLVSGIADVILYAIAALTLARAIYSTKSTRNYGIPILVLALGMVNALYLYAVAQGNTARIFHFFYVGMLCMAVIALLMGRRVIPFFASRAIANLHIPLLARSGPWQLGASGLAIAFVLLNMPGLAAICLVVAGVLAMFQVLAWQPRAVRNAPLLWILYAGYCMLGFGLLVAAAYNLGAVTRLAWPVHTIAVGGFSVLIIGMVTRTALGHLGRPLKVSRALVISYVLIIGAALLRLFALFPTTLSLTALHASTVAWIAGFSIFVWIFLPMMIRPRIEVAAQAARVGITPRSLVKK